MLPAPFRPIVAGALTAIPPQRLDAAVRGLAPILPRGLVQMRLGAKLAKIAAFSGP